MYTREGAVRRRKLIRNSFLASAAAILFVTSFFSLYKYVIIPGRASSYYEEGLNSIRLYTKEKDESEKKRLLREAKEFFIKGEEIDPNSLKYLNSYGVDYMKAGLYDESFEMLFGKVDPPFANWSGRKDVPYISIHDDSKWSDRGVEIGGRIARPDEPVYLTSQDRKKRRIIKAGAYIVSRVKEDQHHIPTYINLGKFHSFHARDFVEGERSKAYKNDTLAIEYYKRVFTDANSPDNISARAGIARIYYNKKEFPKAASEYNKIIEIYPKDPVGHGGILSSYIEIWKRDGNPQFVLNHHRIVKNQLGIEEDLSLFILSKLASFYIDLDPEVTRVRYNVTPEDQVTGMDIDDNASSILSTIFSKTEVVDGEEVVGSKYAEGYYQRGRLFLKQNEALRAMKQFELAASYDFAHFPAVLRMGEYYMRTLDYPEAENLLRNSEKRYKEFRGQYGRRDEDETLIEGDPGRIYFDRGKILYLNASGILEADRIKEFPGRKIYPERAWIKIPDQELERRRRGLYLAQEFFILAQTEPHVLQNPIAKREMLYYEGWIDYMLGSFGSAINKWTDLDEEDLYHNTTLLMGMGNASYYTNQLNSAQSYFQKVMEDYEAKEGMIKRVVYEDQDHQEIYQILVASYNNLGAVHERKGDMVTALSYYWKAIEAARKIDLVSEVANSNKDLLMKKEKHNQLPLLEDWLSPTLGKLSDLLK
jgi:tetratricopeptide (TPR) repeat protein